MVQITCLSGLPDVTEILAFSKLHGARWYWTGRKCVNGHISLRDVASRGCTECRRIRNGKWMSRARASNREAFLRTERASRLRSKDRLGEKGIKMRSRKYNLWNKHRITVEQYEKMFKEQDGKCAICGTTPKIKEQYHRGQSGVLHVDHDHSTGMIRGLLCHSCNQGMCAVDRCIDWPVKVASYISKLKENVS